MYVLSYRDNTKGIQFKEKKKINNMIIFRATPGILQAFKKNLRDNRDR